jgi:hypothetical protein
MTFENTHGTRALLPHIFLLMYATLRIIKHLLSKSPITMKLEYTILEYLSERDDGRFVELTSVHEDYDSLMSALDELKGKNLIVVEDAGRDFSRFGISNNRPKSVKAKLKLNGRAYFHSLKGIEQIKKELRGRSRNRWNMTHFLSF